jgi:choloylglycine hydrolase
MIRPIRKTLTALALATALVAPQIALACTGIRLTALDGGIVYGRTMEWGSFDLNSRVAVVPRGFAMSAKTPDGVGKSWTAKYGVVALDMLQKDYLADGMNEAGLAGGMFYHPGFAHYAEYDPAQAAQSISAVDLLGFVLTQYATIDEIKAGLSALRMVPVPQAEIGNIPVEAHWMFTEPSGKSLVVEYNAGEVEFFDAPLGVITNAPRYDWHVTNLRNYLNLSAVALPSRDLEDMNFSPIGAGSGMIGLPGDFTPPSRFVRAVAWSQTARPTQDGAETTYELFRILDNFNLPLGAAEGSDSVAGDLAGMRSATIWTTAWDISDMTLYFHTMHNRQVRKVDLKAVDFSGDTIRHLPLDQEKKQNVLELMP